MDIRNRSIVFFGELLLRLATPRHERLVQTRNLDCTYTGAEANVAVALSQFGFETVMVSAVPGNKIGDACVNYLRQYGVNVDHIARRGQRLGLFFLETGASQRPSVVIYDRARSSITDLGPGDVEWQEILANRGWFHFCGTAPALGERVAELIAEGCATAKKQGLVVSCDLNYRANLWSPDRAREVMTPLMRNVDYLIGNEEDSSKVFGIGLTADEVDSSEGQLGERYGETAKQLVDRFSLRGAALSVRQSHSASKNTWSGVLYDGERAYNSRQYQIQIVDRVGAGDSFAAGLIYGWLKGMGSQSTLDFAVAASCLKHTIHGDFNLVSVDEVTDLVAANTSFRVKR